METSALAGAGMLSAQGECELTGGLRGVTWTPEAFATPG